MPKGKKPNVSMENMANRPVDEISHTAKNAQAAVHKRYKTIRVSHK
jgi:hypothetical protein